MCSNIDTIAKSPIANVIVLCVCGGSIAEVYVAYAENYLDIYVM